MKTKHSAMISIIGGCVLFVAVVFWANQGFTQPADVIEQIGTNGKVNWSAGIVEATGIGAPPERFYGKPQARPMALRAAQVDAYRNLLEIVKGVRVDAATEVRDFTVSNDVIRAQVEGLVKGAQVVKRDYLSDGTVEVTLRMSLNGDFAQAVLPIPRVLKSEQFDRAAPPIAPQPAAAVPAGPQITTPAAPSSGVVFTGMVVDARGIQARPAMSPKIVDEAGQEVYGSMLVDREFAVQQGMSGYARDLTAAQSNPRVTNNPITVKGIKTDGPGRANIIISNDDAGKIRSASENLTFMKKARVMIVLD
ncbi:MAG: LPP20 family lipoprotein [Syntrophales bacterium]